jgi:hypothetical protein
MVPSVRSVASDVCIAALAMALKDGGIVQFSTAHLAGTTGVRSAGRKCLSEIFGNAAQGFAPVANCKGLCATFICSFNELLFLCLPKGFAPAVL